MEKGTFAKLAEIFGIKVNENALELIDNKYDMPMPDNWDEMSEEEKKAWKEKHMMSNTQTPPEKPKQAPPPVVTQQPAPKADETVLWFNNLIEGMGGREVFQALLLGAVDAVGEYRHNAKSEKDAVIASLVLNSEGRLTAEDLKDMELPVLKIMEKGMAPTQLTDYRLMAAAGIKTNQNDVAVMADIFDAKTWKEG